MNNKGIILVIVLIVLTGGILFMNGSGTEPALAPTTEEKGSAANTAPVATGKADDILASLDSEDAQEAALAQAGDTDSATVLSDEGVISDLTQSYDETAL